MERHFRYVWTLTRSVQSSAKHLHSPNSPTCRVARVKIRYPSAASEFGSIFSMDLSHLSPELSVGDPHSYGLIRLISPIVCTCDILIYPWIKTFRRILWNTRFFRLAWPFSRSFPEDRWVLTVGVMHPDLVEFPGSRHGLARQTRESGWELYIVPATINQTGELRHTCHMFVMPHILIPQFQMRIAEVMKASGSWVLSTSCFQEQNCVGKFSIS
jgi:hypothetical protein